MRWRHARPLPGVGAPHSGAARPLRLKLGLGGRGVVCAVAALAPSLTVSAMGAHAVPSAGAGNLPPSLAAVAQRVVAGRASFAIVRRHGVLSAGGVGFESEFATGGLQLRIAAGTVELRLAAVGGGADHLHALAARSPGAAADVVRYAYPRVVEWYRNGPFGLEQGFTIRSRLSGGGSAVVVALELGGSLTARQHGQEVVFGPAHGAPLLQYDGLSARDATGRVLPSSLRLRGRELLLRVQARGAVYPLEIDPFLQPSTQLVGSGEVGDAGFGGSVALSADGSTALVGGDSDNLGGAVWAFTHTAQGWSQDGSKLIEPDAALFGASVALSANGETALVGAPDTNSDSGAAWVFHRVGTGWRQAGPALVGAGEQGGAWFGSSVALSGNGRVALVGGPDDNFGAGAAWQFTDTGGHWRQDGRKLVDPATAGVGGGFGSSVSLSTSGTIALVGANGEAFVVGLSDAAHPSFVALKSQAGRSADGAFGSTVALSAAGNVAVVGDESAERSGGAYVFTRSGQAWGRGQLVTGGALTPSGAEFGAAVAVSSDGRLLLVGAPLAAGEAGVVLAFRRAAGRWSLLGSALTGGKESGGGEFGSSLALAASGQTVLVGGLLNDNGVGGAWAVQQ